MTTSANGNRVIPDTELSTVPQPSPVPVEETAPDTWTRDRPPAAVPDPEQDLAAETLLKRAERQGREIFIEVGSQLTMRVHHPDGGDSTVQEIQVQETAQRAVIDEETQTKNSRKHRRLPDWIRAIPKYVLLFDFGMLLYFFSGITNVDWSSPLSLAFAFAVVLAAMVTLLSYGFLAFTGHRLRAHKNHAGTIHREDVDGATRAAFVIALVVIAVLAVLMFTRIRTEVLYALGAQGQLTALVIAVAVGVVNAAANALVIAIHALDGSDQTARLDQLSAAIRKPLNRAHQLRKQAAKQVNY